MKRWRRRKRKRCGRRRWRRLLQRQSCEGGQTDGGEDGCSEGLGASWPSLLPPLLCDQRPVRRDSCGDQEQKICPSAAKRCGSPPSLRALLKTCCSAAVNYAILCPWFKMGTFWARRRGSSTPPPPPPPPTPFRLL